jgi:hypothetical protein
MSKKRFALALILVAILSGSLSAAYVMSLPGDYDNPAISFGPYPGAPDYTVWKDSGGTYHAKSDVGYNDVSSSNASEVFELVKDNLPANGGIVTLLDGTYSLPIGLTWLPKATLRGSGDESTILSFTNSSGDGLTMPNTVYGFTLENLKITTTRASSLGSALKLYASRYGIIRNVKIEGNWKYGASITDGSIGNLIERLTIGEWGTLDSGIEDGIYIDSETTNYNIFRFVVIRGCSSVGLNIFDGSDNVFYDVEVGYHTTGSYGIYVHTNADRASFHNPYIENVTNGFVNEGTTTKLQWLQYYDVTTPFSNTGTITVVGTPFENSGVEVIDSGTSVVFNHGLIGTPTFVTASFNDTAITGWKWTATSTEITLTLTPSGDYTVYWDAKYQP